MSESTQQLGDVFHAAHCWNSIGVWSNGEYRCEKLKQLTHCHNCEVYRRTGREIFEREISKNYIQYWSNIYAESDKKETGSFLSLIIFRLAQRWFALPSVTLNEIARYRGIHRIPHHKGGLILGLVNVRGRVSLCYSLGELLGVDESMTDTAAAHGIPHVRRQLLVSINDESYVFQVDEVAGVNRYSRSDFVDVPVSDEVRNNSIVSALLELTDKQVYVLDAQALFLAIQDGAND